MAPGVALALAMLAAAACKAPPSDAPNASPSPQAKAEPAPLATPPSAAAAAAMASGIDGGSPPEPLRADRALPPDVPREVAREPGAKEQPRDLAGYALQAIVRTGEGPGAPKAPEVNGVAIDAAKRRTEARLAIELSPSRARFVLSGGFVLPQGTELRARADRYGHLLLWPGEGTYRVVAPGALRALLGERRLDVAPLSHASTSAAGEGTRRLGLPTRRVEIATRAAKAIFEIASVRDAGEGGVLLCRWLLDLMSAPPATSTCANDEVPLHAELRWTTRGALSLDVISLSRRVDLAAQELATPPAAAVFTAAPAPQALSDVLLARSELGSLRNAPTEAYQANAKDAQAPLPESGLVLVNSSDELKVAWLDGFAAAWVAPGGRAWLPSLVRGRYGLEWRTFLGDSWEPAEAVFVPGISDASGARGGSP
jgi:hypothetical protein